MMRECFGLAESRAGYAPEVGEKMTTSTRTADGLQLDISGKRQSVWG